MPRPLVLLFGRFELEGGAGGRTRPLTGQVAQFLAYLAYQGAWLGRDELAFLFWPDQPDSVARRNLRKLLHRARQHADDLEVDGESVRWVVSTDVRAWREALAEQDWTEAFDLYRGPVLDGLDAGATPEFSDWIEREREAVTRAWRQGLVSRSSELTHADPDRAARLLRRLLDIDPLDEAVLQALLRSLAAAGRRSDLEPTFTAFGRRLERELGLEPAPETRELLLGLKAADDRGQVEPTQRPEPGNSRPTAAPAPPVGRSVFVGRERELAWLEEQLSRAVGGLGGAVAVKGEAGVGKTRLIETFLAGTDDIGVFSARCFERELTVPLEPVRTALAGLAEPKPDEDGEAERFWTADPSDRSTVHQGLAATLVRAATGRRAVVLFIDDVQWADTATLEFLSYAAKRVRGERVLVLVSYRREDYETLEGWLAHLAERRALAELSLGRLAPTQTAALFGELADLPAEEVAWLGAFIHFESEGNPFYAMEYLRWLKDQSVLEFDAAGRITAVAREKLPATALPESVRALISARYQALGEEAREALDLAATIGRSFALELLESASGLEPLTLWSALEPLLGSGLIVAGADEQYSFSHDKLRQTVYKGIAPPLKRALHRRIAAVLERRGADDAELAHHHLRAHAWPQAFHHLDLAAKEAERDHAWEAALQGYARALDIVDRLPEADRKRFSLLHAREKLLEYMERQRERATTIEQMTALAERLADPKLRAEAQLKHMALLMQNGEEAAALEAQRRALQLFKELGDVSAQARVHRERAYAAWTLGDYDELLAASTKALELYRQLGNRRAEAAISGNISQAYRRSGQYEQALEWAERAAEIYQTLGDRLGEYLRLDTRSWVAVEQGDIEAAVALLERILPITEALRDKHLLVEKHMNLGQAYLELDAPEQALEHFRAAAQLGAETGDARHEGYPLMIMGATLERLGQAADAEQAYRRASRLFETAHAVSGSADEQIAHADALTLLAGTVQPDLARSAEALAAFEAAEAIFLRHRESSRVSKLLMDRGALHWRLDHLGAATADFERAAENARRSEAPVRETAALASLGVVYRDAGRLGDSVAASLEALERLQALDDRQAEAYVLSSLASSYRALGELADARSSLEASLRLRHDLGDAAGEAQVLDDLADLASQTSS